MTSNSVATMTDATGRSRQDSNLAASDRNNKKGKASFVDTTAVATTVLALNSTKLKRIKVMLAHQLERLNYNVLAATRLFMAELKKVEPGLKVFALDPYGPCLDDPSHMKDKAAFERYVDYHTMPPPNRHLDHHCMIFTIESSRLVHQFRGLLLQFLKEKNLWIHQYEWSSTTVSKLGFLLYVHPRITDRYDIEQLTADWLLEIATDITKPIPKFQLVFHNPFYKNEAGEKIETEALQIQCEEGGAPYLLSLFGSDAFKTHTNKRFIPDGMYNDPTQRGTWLNIIYEQNAYMAKYTTVKVEGIPHMAREVFIGSQQCQLGAFLLRSSAPDATIYMEFHRAKTQDCWRVAGWKTQKKEIISELDSLFNKWWPELMKTVDPEHLKYFLAEGYTIPRRSDTRKQTDNSSLAAMSKNLMDEFDGSRTTAITTALPPRKRRVRTATYADVIQQVPSSPSMSKQEIIDLISESTQSADTPPTEVHDLVATAVRDAVQQQTPLTISNKENAPMDVDGMIATKVGASMAAAHDGHTHLADQVKAQAAVQAAQQKQLDEAIKKLDNMDSTVKSLDSHCTSVEKSVQEFLRTQREEKAANAEQAETHNNFMKMMMQQFKPNNHNNTGYCATPGAPPPDNTGYAGTVASTSATPAPHNSARGGGPS